MKKIKIQDKVYIISGDYDIGEVEIVLDMISRVKNAVFENLKGNSSDCYLDVDYGFIMDCLPDDLNLTEETEENYLAIF